MQMYGDELRVQQGEDFNFDRLLSSSSASYIPYIVSSKRLDGGREAYFVITVASTKFEKNLRYVCSFWNQISKGHKNTEKSFIESGDIPTFFQTTPFSTSLNQNRLPENIASFRGSVNDDEDETRPYLYQYLNSDTNEYEYFWWDYSDKDNAKIVKGYECHVRFNFTSNITKDWTGQNYMYQVTLVSGQPMRNKIKAIIDSHTVSGEKTDDFPRPIVEGQVDEETLKKQFRYIKARWPYEFQSDIDETSPLGTIETPEVILQPTKLEVFNNLRKLI